MDFAAKRSWILVGIVLCAIQAKAEDSPFDQLLRASHEARANQQQESDQQRTRQAIKLGPWHIVGPMKDQAYGNLVRSFNHPFEPEADVLAAGADAANLTKVYTANKFPGMLGTRRPWLERPDWVDGYRHLLPRGPAPSRNETVYLYRTIRAAQPVVKTMRVYAEDFVGAWLNGESLGQAARNYGPHRYPVPLVVSVPLRAGENRLLVKITSMYGAHGFAFALDGETPSNTLEPLQPSLDLIGDATRSNFHPGNRPYASAEPVIDIPSEADYETLVRDIAARLVVPEDVVRQSLRARVALAACQPVCPGANGDSTRSAPQQRPHWLTSSQCHPTAVHDHVCRLDHALRATRKFKFDVTMTPMFDPPTSPMAELLETDFPPSLGSKAYADALAPVEKQVRAALDRFEAGRPAAADEVIAAAEALTAMWDEQVRQLGPIVFLRCPPFAVNAIAPYTSAGASPASICVFDPARPSQPPRVVFHEPGTVIYDMNVSYDAQTIFFSAKRPGAPGGWHIYEIGVDGGEPRQITLGDSNDISPLLLPDGRMMFVSDRANTWVQCQGHRAGLLYTCDRNGGQLRKVSANIDSDHSPQIMNDGRVLFTRWDYGVEKNVFARHALWSMNPDGRRFELFFGNTIEDPAAFWEARPVPGRPEVICTFGPHHSYHAGMLGLVWKQRGAEAPRGEGFRFLTDEIPVYCDTTLPHGFQDAFPVHERLFLMSYGGDGGLKNRLYLLDNLGNRRCVYEAAGNLGCWNPMLLRPREIPPVLSSSSDDLQWTYRDAEEMNADPDSLRGTFIVQDVYRGLEPLVSRGDAKYIQVIEQVQKSRRMAGGEAWGHTPIIGRGTVHVRRVIGLVPIEADGSAHFRAPALRNISLNVLDAQGKTLMRMGSDMHVMPGETASCVGCHENRRSAVAPLPQDTRLLATQHPPIDPQPTNWGTGGILDYQKVVQPVWDRYCVECHSGPTPDGHLDLTGDRTRFFCMSYDNLVERDLAPFDAVFAGGHDENAPLTLGSVVAPLCEYIDTSEHSGQEIPLEERRRVYHWIDANVPYYGTYDYAKVRGIGARDSWETGGGTAQSGWLMRGVGTTFERRCLSCHARQINNQGMWGWLSGPMTQMVNVSSDLWTDRGVTAHVFPQRYPMSAKLGPELRINLTRPSNSSLLQAPLAEAAGGWGLCVEVDGSPVFADKTDSDYRRMLLAIETGKSRLYAEPRVDMSADHVEQVRSTVLAEEILAAAEQDRRPKPEASDGIAYLDAIPPGAVNLSRGATASSPDEAALQTNSSGLVGVQGAIDGNPNTYWDDIDNAPVYRLRIEFPDETTVSAMSLLGWAHHDFAPKDFRIVCDDREIGSVRNAEYENNRLRLSFPRTTCRRLELVITASHGGSPGVRELDLYDLPDER